MPRRLPLSVAFVALILLAPARADDDSQVTSIVRPASRLSQPQTIERSGRRPAHPNASKALRQSIKKIWAGRELRRGTTAIYVVDAETGEELYKVHADKKLNPASSVKLISTAAVLDALGPDWRFETRLYGGNPGKNGVSRGDLYLLGQADPTLDPKRLGFLAQVLALRGVVRIEGDLLIGDHVLRDTVTPRRIKVVVTGARRAGKPAKVEVTPMSEFIRIENRTKTTVRRRGLRVATGLEETVAGKPRLVVKVTGRVRRNHSGRFFRGVGKPSYFTAHTLSAALRRAGVDVTGNVVITDFGDYAASAAAAGYFPVVLARSRSRPLRDLVAQTNKHSLNFLADRLAMTAAARILGGDLDPDMKQAAVLMRQWLERAGVDPAKVVLDSASGLSSRTQLSARQLVQVLRVAGGYGGKRELGLRVYPEVFRDSLAVGGEEGTLERRFRDSPVRGKVIGKTGSLTGGVALSGFVGTGDRILCFSIITNENHDRVGLRRNGRRARRARAWSYRVRRQHEVLVETLFDFLDKSSPLSEMARRKSGAVPAAGSSSD